MKRPGRPSEFDPKFCQQVIDLGEEGCSLTEMAVAIGVSRETFHNWREAHESFGKAVKMALENSQAWWESESRKATFGKTPGFNATSYIFNMKNRFGHDYSDVSRVDVNSTVNHNINLDSLTQDQLTQLALMLAPKASEDDALVIDHEG